MIFLLFFRKRAILKRLVFFLFFLFLFCCKSFPEKGDALKKDENKNEKYFSDDKRNEINEKEKFTFEFVDFFCEITDAKESASGIFDLTYNYNFNFRYGKDFKVSYKIFDEENVEIFSKEVFAKKRKADIYSIEGSFSDPLSHKVLRYSFIAFLDSKTEEYGGEFINPTAPYIEKFLFGPIVSEYKNNKLETSSSLELDIKNVEKIKWIRFIPPSQNYFWEINYSLFDDQVISNSSVIDEKNSRYFENGVYILQVNFGEKGLIQKKFELVDILGNSNGKNYGLSIAEETVNDKNKLKLDIPQFEKVETMDIEIFDANTKQKLGAASFLSPPKEIDKKELFKSFKNEYGDEVKLKYNKKYFYKIFLYSKEVNKIRYISISSEKQLTFSGFSFM